MIVKSLVTGMAAAALVGAAAVGTTVASQPAGLTAGTSPAVAPVVRQVPLPQAPAPGLQASLVSTLSGLTAAGSFALSIDRRSRSSTPGCGKPRNRVAFAAAPNPS